MDALIYDRTQADLVNKTEKGYHNYTDINRIEEWCGYLAELLTSYGYVVHITTKTDWKMTDYRKASEIERIRSNIAAIENAYAIMKNTPQLPNTLNPIDIERANAIEKILFDINLLITNMKASFLYCGTFNAGESEGLI